MRFMLPRNNKQAKGGHEGRLNIYRVGRGKYGTVRPVELLLPPPLEALLDAPLNVPEMDLLCATLVPTRPKATMAAITRRVFMEKSFRGCIGPIRNAESRLDRVRAICSY